ncbi:outer membrane protein assembly factor BamD [Halomonas sabkhae]|uniref:outer membrane protein assembly factor BamD n=1 Tax=Halomonas sabkhae TaxID=626223 RepID=UPI0025B382A1|nr:outer membrane protein assembly factor BamD [Halomonas sabkhae]MDN3525175.1 outer membrane protein assembly factor BamD [Halomonas sabkhae]
MRVFTTGTRLAAMMLATALLAGCASTEEEEQAPDVAESQLYQEGRAALEDGRYTTAVNRLEAIDTRYPFGEHAEQAQLELIYAHFETDDWEAARAAASRFIRLHPDHPQIDYAYYMRGLASWEAGRFSLESLRLIDIAKRDLGATRDAYSDFRDLVRNYPNSQYAPDARQRIVYLRNLLARHELEVADFYLRKGAYLAAIKRGRWVIENYPEADGTRDALAVMVEGYLGLDMTERAKESLQVLIDNAPDHERLDGRTFDPRYIDAEVSA